VSGLGRVGKCQAQSQFIGSKVGDNIEVLFWPQIITHAWRRQWLPRRGCFPVVGALTPKIRIALTQAAIPRRPETKRKFV